MNDSAQKECVNIDGTLNSTKVSNKFKKKLEHVREYSRSDVRRNGEAVVLLTLSLASTPQPKATGETITLFPMETEVGRKLIHTKTGIESHLPIKIRMAVCWS